MSWGRYANAEWHCDDCMKVKAPSKRASKAIVLEGRACVACQKIVTQGWCVVPRLGEKRSATDSRGASD